MEEKTLEDRAQGMEYPPLRFWRRTNPFVQNILISACLFCNPGFFVAVAYLGAGGGRPSSTIMADTSNGVLYGVFTFSAILTPTFLNAVGPRWTTVIGVTGYPLYTGALWYFDAHGQLWFPVFAGAYLGLSAGCLWTTATFISSSYPEEKDKGLQRAMQWMGNMSGATIGSALALGINWNGLTYLLTDPIPAATSEGVPHAVYIVFIIIQCCFVCFALLLLPPEKLVRSDGTHLARFQHISVWESLKGTGRLFKDWRILIMIPTFFTPEMFFPLQGSINAYAYSLRTRSLNAFLNSIIQLPISFAMGYLLDNERLGNRKRRAFLAITIDAVWITGAYIAQTVWLSSWKFDRSIPGPKIDITDKAYGGAAVVYLATGVQYGIFQNVVIWMFASLTNDPRKLASISGLFIGVLSAGTAVSFGTDATAQPYENENAAIFALATLCWPILYFVAWKCTTDTNYFKESDVIVPLHVQEAMGSGLKSMTVGEKMEGTKGSSTAVDAPVLGNDHSRGHFL